MHRRQCRWDSIFHRVNKSLNISLSDKPSKDAYRAILMIHKEVKEWILFLFKEIAERFIFRLEDSENFNHHFIVWLKLKRKTRGTTCVELNWLSGSTCVEEHKWYNRAWRDILNKSWRERREYWDRGWRLLDRLWLITMNKTRTRFCGTFDIQFHRSSLVQVTAEALNYLFAKETERLSNGYSWLTSQGSRWKAER